MRKILLASVAAASLAAGIGSAFAADPGEEQLYHDRYGTYGLTRDDPYIPRSNAAPNMAGQASNFAPFAPFGALGFANEQYNYED